MKPTILCPVDFSLQSRRALRYASALADRSHSRLAVLFVEDPLLFAASARNDEIAQKQELHVRLEKFVGQVLRAGRKAAQPLTINVAVGNAATEIQAAARRLRCDVIVMGSHGLTGATRLLLGSTTEQVLRQASVPVLVIPPTHRGAIGITSILSGARRRA